MTHLVAEPASFRDPRGQIFYADNTVLRAVFPPGVADFDYVRRTDLLPKLIVNGQLLDETIVDKNLYSKAENLSAKSILVDASYVLEHPRLPFISYPYEWPFAALKAAALLHLDILLQALPEGITLTDASAYNIQFQGPQPIFIDHLAFCRYQQGDLWQGYRQFCEQFLNPLLLQAYLHFPYQALYRSQPMGIKSLELRQLLPWYRKLLPKPFLHVVLQSYLQGVSNRTTAAVLPKVTFPLKKLIKMLNKLHQWISSLHFTTKNTTIWQNYTSSPKHFLEKAGIVAEFCQQIKPSLIYDLGCNKGEYATIALKNGAKSVVGFDSDQVVLELAFKRAVDEKLNFLPLYMELENPSPAQGWMQEEKRGLLERGPAKAVLGLAILHHLALIQNIPLSKIISWLLKLAPQGLVEFVPKTDSMVQEMLCLRADIFDQYDFEIFLQLLKQQANVIKVFSLSNSDRKLVWYQTC